MDVQEIRKVRHYKNGYYTQEEKYLVEGGDKLHWFIDEKGKRKYYKYPKYIWSEKAYTTNGDYIGNKKIAHFLCDKKGIRPEKRTPDSNVCSIGFCEKEQKWYGWSHRAIYGFGIGSTCKMGDCHFIPSNRQEYIKDLKQFWNNHKIEVLEDKILVTNVKTSLSWEEPLDIEYGKGEWIAETLDDARQMACDFAKEVG